MQILEIFEPGQTPLPHEGERNVAVGIDLGTTNSLVALARDGKPEVLRDAAGVGMVPSVVCYSDDDVVVGEAARQHLLDRPDRVISSIKRLMGRGVKDLQTLSGSLPFALEPGEDGRMVRLVVGNRRLTPVEISADILRALKLRAEISLGQPVQRAVITVPAYFDDAARTATRDAARLAGFEVLRLVNEPTAAALAYGLDKGAEGLYAIYDLGGGTFDVSILRLEKGVFQVLATGGDAQLGGDDFDHALAEHLIERQAKDSGRAEELSTSEAKRLLAECRRLKEALSEADSAEAELEIGGKRSRHGVSRQDFEALIAPLVDRTIATAKRVLFDANLTTAEIKGVVLVGGSTRVPMVRRAVETLFGRAPLSDIDPDEVVALGAALQAEALTRGSDTLLLDVTPLSLGIETMGGLVEKVIARNATIPVARAQEFTTYQDGQNAMLIHVVQGERELANQNRSLARFVLKDIPPMTAGAARIRVMFAVDADGLLTVSAEEKTTGVAAHVEVKPSYGLTEDEMAAMLRDSMQFARDDMEVRLLTEARVDAERVLLALRSALQADGDLLSASEHAEIEREMSAVEAAKAGKDRAQINDAVEQLDRATQEFASRRMDRNINAALRGQSLEQLGRKVGSGE